MRLAVFVAWVIFMAMFIGVVKFFPAEITYKYNQTRNGYAAALVINQERVHFAEERFNNKQR